MSRTRIVEILDELAERLGNLDDSARALADCLETRDVSRKANQRHDRGSQVHVSQFAGEKRVMIWIA